MDDIYARIQVLLMRKDKECGMLKFLTSRTTKDNAQHVTELCESVREIVELSGIGAGNHEDSRYNEDRVQCFKYLMMNTYFRVQEHLCEDIVNGYLVDMCPPLSPYLFLEIVWHLEYEEILAESLLHAPLDLCVEVLEIVRRCADLLEFERALNTLMTLITNGYKKLKLMLRSGTDAQTLEPDDILNRFIASVQELVVLLADSRVTETAEFRGLEKYKRHGFILKKILRMARDCFESGTVDGTETIDLEKMYRVTFGRGYMEKLASTTLAESLDVFNKELVELLLGHIKKIDCNIYLGWAELDDFDDGSISLQRAIGIDCYHLMRSISENEKLTENDHLVECLKQLSTEPEPKMMPSSMSLEMLRDNIGKGSKECLKELIDRYEEWDADVLSCLEKNYGSMDKTDCLNLLGNGAQLLAQPAQKDIHETVYATVMRAPLFQSLIDNYEIVVEFILKHDAGNVLESVNFEMDFKNFVTQNMTFCSDENSLRTILFFIVQNPKKVLTALLKIAIGVAEHSNAMILPADLCKLSPIMQILDVNELSLLTNALINICNENAPWHAKKFAHLMQALLERDILSADYLINNIFIPYLQNESLAISNIQSILNCIRTVKNRCTIEMNMHDLLKVMAKKLTELRKDLSKYRTGETLNLLIRIIEYFVKEQSNWLNAVRKECLIDEINFFLEPIDRVYFAPLWFSTRNRYYIDQIMQDYEKRCLLVINKFSDAGANSGNTLNQYGVDSKDFLRHLILRCTEAEFMRFALDATIFHWDYFGWTSEVNAYEEFCLVTIDACNYCLNLQSSSSNSLESFAFLIRCLIKLSTRFISIDGMNDYDGVHKSLVRSMKSLEKSLNDSRFAQYCDDLMILVHHSSDTNHTFRTVTQLLRCIDEFGSTCARNCCQPKHEKTACLETLKFHAKNEFISVCIEFPLADADTLFSKLDRRVYPAYHEDGRRDYNVVKKDNDQGSALFVES